MNLLDIYKCNICGNIVEIIHSGGGELVCCSQPMERLKEQTNEDMNLEKHLPVIERDGENVKIKVGKIPHPMTLEHHIEFIEAISEDKKYIKRKFLHPEEEPILEFKCNCGKIIAREYCNIHGVWKDQEND